MLSAAFCAAGSFVCSAGPVQADPAFRVGKLDSGLSYYLYHHENPKGCAEFYIVHNVGAMQEEDNQNGLAHFLEHMAFNGTKNYPGKGILEFLDKEGVRFGYNVNAYTSRHETVYNLSKVPLVRESFVDSVLMVLHDWSCDISCEQQALDDERGVIREEWRLRDEPRSRMYYMQQGIVYEGHRQAERTVIGTLDVIDNFKREEILDFYHTWYRPDLQAIVVVGDFDVNEMEARVRRLFSDIPAHPSPRAKDCAQLPVPQGIRFSKMTDPATKQIVLKYMCLQSYPGFEDRASMSTVSDRFARQIVSNILTARFKEKMGDPGCPLRSAVVVTSDYQPDYYLTLFTITPRDEKDLVSPVEYMQTEIERLCRFGFTQHEFDVAKASVVKSMHLKSPLPVEQVRSGDIVKMCVEHFLRNFPLVTPTQWRKLQLEAMDAVDYQFASAYPEKMMRESGKICCYYYNPSRENEIPDAGQLRAALERGAAADVRAETKETVELDFTASPVPGTIVSDKPVKDSKGRIWKLSNGATVYYLHCDKVPGDMRLCASYEFDGGWARYDQERIGASRFALGLIKKYAGFKNFDRNILREYPEIDGINTLMGLRRWDNAYWTFNAFDGKVDDAFKYLYLSLTEPCMPSVKDIEREKFIQLQNLAKGKTDKARFVEDYEDFRYGNHPWFARIDSAAVLSVDRDFVADVYSRLYSGFDSMSVYIASDLPEDEVRGMVCKWVASLSDGASAKKTVSKVKPCRTATGGYRDLMVDKPASSQPLCAVDYEFFTKLPNTARNCVEVDILDYILSQRYLNLIREERGGTYHISFSSEFTPEEPGTLYSEVSFQTRPAMKEMLLGDLKTVMEEFCADGPTREEVDAAVRYLIKHHGEKLARIPKSLQSQKDVLEATVKDGYNPIFDYKTVVSKVKPSDIRSLARRINRSGRLLSVYTEE